LPTTTTVNRLPPLLPPAAQPLRPITASKQRLRAACFGRRVSLVLFRSMMERRAVGRRGLTVVSYFGVRHLR
jgi:hypothetical protein